MKLTIKMFVLLLAAIAFSPAWCEESKPKDDETTASSEKTAREQKAGADSPSPKSLKEKKLGDTFDRFIPTEVISADNAVPFPVDI